MSFKALGYPKHITDGQQWIFDLGITTLLKWLKEPCEKHPGLREYPEHRYLCPDCMKELEG